MTPARVFVLASPIRPMLVARARAGTLACAMLGLGAGQPVSAQSAGAALNQIPLLPAPVRPAAKPSVTLTPAPVPSLDSARYLIKTLHIVGQTQFSEARLLEASGLAGGDTVDAKMLAVATARIGAYYASHGYPLAQGYVPVQDFRDGSLIIAVSEGLYGDISFEDDTRLSSRVSARLLDRLRPGDVVTDAALQRAVLLLSDVPGIATTSAMVPGKVPGTQDLRIKIVPSALVSGSVEADNSGNRYSGYFRLGGAVYLNNPLGYGDQIGMRGLVSNNGLNYVRASYRLLLGETTVSASLAHLNYKLGREYQRYGFRGSADVATLAASFPLLRSVASNIVLTGSVEGRLLDDRIDSLNVANRRRMLVSGIGIAGQTRDRFGGGGVTSYAVNGNIGDVSFRSVDARARDASTAQTQGRFLKAAMAVGREQVIHGPLSLYVAARGQLASQSLDTSEKLQLGGVGGVRAYPEGEVFGDTGYIVNLETRLALTPFLPDISGQLLLSGFWEQGYVTANRNAFLDGPNHARRAGAGVGLNWTSSHRLAVKASYARRVDNTKVTSEPDAAGRFWLQVSQVF